MTTTLVLKKKPKGVTIIEGFPGIGLIGTITTEFLMEHLKTEQIGSVFIDDVPAIIAVHGKKVVEPISIHYNKKYNIVIIHAIGLGHGLGWDLANIVQDMSRQLEAKEIVSVEGVGSAQPTENSNIFFFSSDEKKGKALEKIAKPLQEGIIVGVTGALLAGAKESKVPITAFFGETYSNLPDSKAAAAIIRVLDDYLGLDVDPKPLIKQADEFERKLRKIMEQTKETTDLQKKKTLSYVG